MATQFEIRCTHPDEAYARQAARFAFDAVDRLEQQLSRFVENSDIARINHLVPGEETRIAYETLHCLQLARLVYEQTGGAFDPSIGSGLNDLEVVAQQFLVRRVPLLHDAGYLGDSGSGTARGPQLDFGAIGKGYAVDRVAEALEDWDVTEALIDAGYSSVLALEPPSGAGDWALSLSTPDTAGGSVFARIGARQLALGASGIQKGDHIRNPFDGSPVRVRQAAWVSAPRQVLAALAADADLAPSPAAIVDALATAFMIMPPGTIADYCQAHPGIKAWIFDDRVLQFSYRAR